jgi:hypothetical protein
MPEKHRRPSPPLRPVQLRDRKAEAELASLRQEKRESRRFKQKQQAEAWGDD